MATMVKEKRREKKRTKEKQAPKSNIEAEQPSVLGETKPVEDKILEDKSIEKTDENSPQIFVEATVPSEKIVEANNGNIDAINPELTSVKQETVSTNKNLASDQINISVTKSSTQVKSDYNTRTTETSEFTVSYEKLETSHVGNTFLDLNYKLDRMSIPSLEPALDSEDIESGFESHEYITQAESSNNIESIENAVPSAPVFEEEMQIQVIQHQEVIKKQLKPKVHCMSLEEAIKLFGGVEIAEVRAMSEREEALVEAGPVSGPEHPLVDLLSTFRSSLIAVERERTKLAQGFSEEQKFRESLWKVDKRDVSIVEKCSCGLNVKLRVFYEDAEFLKEKLPVAKMRLEGLLRDVQDTYCHHQHAALLAHCQIEELICEIMQGSKADIREALSLVLQALRLSDNAPAALATALQRWATVLSAALLDGGDLRQLLFLIHHLFRQARSVHWAARVIRFAIVDRSAAAQAVALLDLLLTRPRLEAAVECTEEADEVWEEVDVRGKGCVVSSGSLRERDLLALLEALSLRNLVARLVLLTHADLKHARQHDWYDASLGLGVLRACGGARALLDVLQRATRAHAHYERLRARLRRLAADVLHALAGLHLHTKETYSAELKDKIQTELEATFAAGVGLFGAVELHRLPATLLSDDTAEDYCLAVIMGLHDKTPKQLTSLSIEMPAVACEVRVRIVVQAAMDRHDHELANMVLEFLIQCGIKRKMTACKGTCDMTAKELMPRLLAAHPYLHTLAIHCVANLNQAETLDGSSLKPLSLETWRPTVGEMRAVLDDWSQRCPHLLQHLLLGLQYAAHVGVSLDVQLTIGTWLSTWSVAPPEWAWLVLRRLRVHRSHWGAALEAPPPEFAGGGLFALAYAVLSSSWGHCIPVICTEGVTALCELAAVRARDAAHCLAPVMLVMAHSPESISLTPKFNSLFSQLLDSGPTLMQRALGLGPESGADLLLRVILTQLNSDTPGPPRSAILSAWLHALWVPSLPSARVLDTALLECREWTVLDRHTQLILQQSQNANEYISHAVRNAWQAPLMCECMLRNAYAQREANSQVYGRLLDALHVQRIAGNKIHVDNALKLIGSSMTSSDLVVYRTATALLTAPLQHPSHLTLWRLLFHLYLQRPSLQEGVAPIGPLFFSGLVNSRTLAQLRKRLQETITYHHDESEKLKGEIKEENSQKPSTSKIVKSDSNTTDDNFIPALSIVDLTGESSDSSDSESSRSEEEVEGAKGTAAVKKDNISNLLCYHVSAEKMTREYLRWLDEGEKVIAMPHHADIARFIPEQALEAAWSSTLSTRRPSPLEEHAPPPVRVTPQPDTTPFQAVVRRILKIRDRSSRRLRKPALKSPLDEVNFDDGRSLLRLVDKHLSDIEQLAYEWSKQVAHVASLDSALWQLVAQLRVRRPLPPVTRACANRCKPITIHISQQEWCISTGAKQSIQENRASARAGVRRVARARPHAARTAASLHAIARRIRSSDVARSVIERAWRAAGAAAACAPAHTALTALVTDLAERWLCDDGAACAALVSRWSGGAGALQRALCGALVAPPRLRREHYTVLYAALLRAALPPHAAFSYLSKFDMNLWSVTASSEQRREVLSELTTAAQRWGPAPRAEYQVLLELLGVHTVAVARAADLCVLVTACARACVARSLPPSHCSHVANAVRTHAGDVPFDQLGHLLRELGVMWWEARTGIKTAQYASHTEQYAKYAPYMGELLHALQRAFVAAAVALSYAPERVAWYSWSSLLESWSPWVAPHPAAPPLLPSTGDAEAYTPILRHFVDTLHQIMLDCPGTEEHLLQQIFEWTIQSYLTVNAMTSQESQVQMSAILVELTKLPWNEHQWVRENSVQAALQISSSSDKEVTSWCSNVWRGQMAATWLRAAPDSLRLATLLYLFTGMPQSAQTLEQASQLPWSRLPEPALEEALERFFVQYHNPNMPYHELPQFRVLLFASELAIHTTSPPAPTTLARQKRARLVSQWTRAACAPTLAAHVPSHCTAVLSTITDIAPYLESSEGDIEELLSRAIVIMCLEPAATAALPVWQRWVTSASPRMILASLSAVGVLTAFEYFAALADTAAHAHLTYKESSGWSAIKQRWSSSPWHDPSPLVTRTRLHAAYGTALTHALDYNCMRTALLPLLATSHNFVENEVIIATWICLACRIARTCRGDDLQLQCANAAESLISRWGQEPRLNILRVVTLQSDNGQPTAQHRLLCRLAQCILTPGSESAVHAYEASCTAVLGTNPDVLSWGKAPHPKRLPRLAMMLYPNDERYFKEELELAPENL